jgi:hypothetical protein
MGSPTGAPHIIGIQKNDQTAMMLQARIKRGRKITLVNITATYESQAKSCLAKAEYFSFMAGSTLKWWRV